MPLARLFEKLLLRPSDLDSSREDFEVVGVFNPGAVRVGGEVVLLVRVAESPRESRPGYTGLPRWQNHGELTIDWVKNDELDVVDPRVVRRKADGLVRLTFTSHLRVVRCGDGRSVEEVTDVKFRPDSEIEEYGVEDPRITLINGRFYFTYVAVSRHGAATALASTADFRDVHAARRDLLLREQGCGPLPRPDRRRVTWPCTGPIRRRRSAAPRCGSPGRKT